MRQAIKLSAEPATLTVENSSDSGEIKLNTLNLGAIDKWSGKYHKDYDLTLTAAPKEGVSFDHWEISGVQLTSGSEKSETINLKITGSGATVKAVYKDQTAKIDYPTNIKVNYSSEYHQIQFIWDAVEGADKYGIAVYLAGKWRVQTSNITATSYVTPKNLTPGKQYKVAIAARVNGTWNTIDPIKNAVTVTVK